MARKGGKFASFIGVLIILAILFGIGYFVYVFTGEFSTDFKTFYVEVDGVKYVKDGNNLSFTEEKTRIDVHYTFEKVQSTKLSFHYEILPAGADFNFTVDGEKVSWLNVGGLDKAFDAKSDEDGVTLNCVNKTVLDVLQAVYPDSQIDLPEIDEKQSLYKIILMSEDKRASISLSFSTYQVPVIETITLDKTQITF